MLGDAHILVVDDEVELRDMVRDYLGRHGLIVSTAEGGEAMREVLAARQVDLVLLDIRMPGEDGLSLARYLRQRGDVGVIMLTAFGDAVDKVVGLEMGADDYLAKPFNPRELLARVRSVLRRIRPEEPSPRRSEREVRCGRCIINLETRKLYDLDGAEVAMTAMEFDLLQALATRPNRVLSRDQLLDLAHNREMEPFDRSVDIRIWRLRRKIEPDPAKPEVIKTVRGGGYVFVPASAQPRVTE